jgi:putative spermidine/putrescine transport system substrate-binding protein
VLLAAALFAPVPAAAAQPVLRVLAWPGYAEPEVVKSFEQQHAVRVELTVVTADASLWDKINSHNYDVFAVNAAELQRYLAANLVQPLQPDAIPNTHKQLARFRDLAAIPGLMRNGKAYAIPFTYAQMGLIYDRKQFSSPPRSIDALWDARYRGKVVAYDGGTHNFSLAAQSLRLASPFRIAPEDFPRAAERLIALRRNALAFYTQPEESVHLFMRHGAALMFANYGMQQVHLLRQAGADVGYVMPQEGALAWLDCWSITRDAHDIRLAQDWIDHLLDQQASRFLVERQGLSNTLSDERNGQPEGKPVWLQPPEDTAWREKLWSRIRSGDRLSRVLAP